MGKESNEWNTSTSNWGDPTADAEIIDKDLRLTLKRDDAFFALGNHVVFDSSEPATGSPTGSPIIIQAGGVTVASMKVTTGSEMESERNPCTNVSPQRGEGTKK